MILRRIKKTQLQHEHCLLMLEIPRENDKKELAAEQMLAALHGILRTKRELRTSGTLQEHISLEIAAKGQRIRFYIWTPKHLQAFLEGQIYAQYPTVQITEQETDYSERELSQDVIHTAELTLTDHETMPIKTFPSFEVDPLAAITATLAKLDKESEEMWIQIIARPIADDWHKRGAKMAARIKGGRGVMSGGGTATLNYAGQAFAALLRPPDATGKEGGGEAELSERDKARITAIGTKSEKLGYQVKIRLLYAGNDQRTARLRMQALVGAFKQFNTTNLNGFKSKSESFNPDKRLEYQTRFFIDQGFILNIEELASLFHLPHTTVETPNIVWATTKTAEPPANIPIVEPGKEEDISLFGVTNFRGDNTVFGIHRGDRGRHMYILGQTGAGKSGALELLTISDIYYNQGFAVIDPHGDYAQHVLSFIPKNRVDDVVYFNPADTQHPIGFNPLEISDPSLKGHISSEVVGVLKRLFADSWGPRLEYILRYTLLALLDFPNSTMLDITRMLTDRQFRSDVIKYIDDPVVKNFWTVEFASWNDKFASEAVAPVLNKVGAFTANPMIRNIVGQPKSTFDIRQIMDEGKILIVNLSRGLMGEDNAAILGGLLVTKIQLAAMSRADVPESQRRPFYLYVDEFQNFATDSFATILSEARKYALNLTVANQYISQMAQEVRDAVFGNVGTIMSFRVSPDDAPFLQKYFEPEFEAANLIQQHSRFFVISMMIDGEKAPGFSAKTLNLPTPPDDNSELIIAQTRERYSRDKKEVEDVVRKASGHPDIAKAPPPSTTPEIEKQKLSSREQLIKLATGVTHPAKAGDNRSQPSQPEQSRPAQQQQRPQPQQQSRQPEQSGQEPAKRKRSRRRRGGNSGSRADTHREAQNTPKPAQDKPASDEHVIKLR